MFERKTQNKEAEAIVSKLNLLDETGNPMSDNAEIFKENIRHEIRRYLDYCKEEHSDNDKAIARRYVTAALAWYNNEMRMRRIEQLQALPADQAVIAFIATQRVPGLKLVENKKEGTMSFEADTEKVEIDPADFYRHMLTADLNYIQDMCCIFADNVAKKKISDEGKDGKNVFVTKNSMSEDYLKLREKLGWNFADPKDITNNKLSAHLNEIVGRLCFLSADDRKAKKWLIKMIGPDVTFIKDTIIDTNGATKGASDKGGEYILRDEMTIIRAIFKAMYTRYKKLPYSFQNQTNSEKTARVYGNNSDMAEPPVKPSEKPEAGPVTLGASEA